MLLQHFPLKEYMHEWFWLLYIYKISQLHITVYKWVKEHVQVSLHRLSFILSLSALRTTHLICLAFICFYNRSVKYPPIITHSNIVNQKILIAVGLFLKVKLGKCINIGMKVLYHKLPAYVCWSMIQWCQCKRWVSCQILGCYKNKSATDVGVRMHILKGSSILFSNHQCFVKTLLFQIVFLLKVLF